MAARADYAIVEVNGTQFDKWTDYNIESDLLTAADGFSLTIPMPGDGPSRVAMRDVYKPGSSIKVYIVRNGVKALQLTGIVDQREVGGERGDGTKMTVTGRDLARHLVDSDADPLIGVTGTTIRHTELVAERDLLFVGNLNTPEFSQADVRPLESFELEPDSPGSRAPKGGGSIVFVEPLHANMSLVNPDPAFKVVQNRSDGRFINPLTTKSTFVQTRMVETIVETESPNPKFSDVVRKLVSPWKIPVVCDATAARDLLSGRAATVPSTRRAIDAAKNLGVPADSYRRDMANKALASGKPVDSLLGVTTSTSGRSRFANGMTASDIDRLTIDQAKPGVGEKIWEFIERHAKRLGLMLWFSPDGKLILSSPNYGSAPLYRFVKRLVDNPRDPNNVISSSGIDRIGDRCSHVTVYGRGGGRHPERSSYTSTAIDTEVPFYCPRYLQDDTVRSVEGAEARAVRDVSTMRAKGFEYSCSVADHGQGDVIYAIDNMAQVIDEVIGVQGEFYITSRTFKRSRESGDATRTTLKLMPKGSIEL